MEGSAVPVRRKSAGSIDSEPADAGRAAFVAEGIKRKLGTCKKSQTVCVTSVTSDRLSTVKVSPEALAKLHKLHELYMRIKDKEAFEQSQDTSHAALKAAFKTEPSWQIHAILPKDGFERPSTKRTFKYWGAPQTGLIPGTESDAMLRHWGAVLVNTKGLKGIGDLSLGQDNCSIATLKDGWEVFCVCDGHGPDGHWPSATASRTFPFFLQGAGCLKMLNGGGFEAALTTTFEKVEKDLEKKAREEDIKISFSGCTATVAIRDKVRDDLWVAHVGDSRAVLLVPGEGVVYSTEDHKPWIEAEKRRLEENGCVIEHYRFDDGETDDRVFVKDEKYPGMNMTRSLGDLCVKDHGVWAVPEVRRWDMSKWKQAYYLACSDGVWEYLSNDQVANMILESLAKGQSCQEAVEELLQEARQSWLQRTPEYMDDITILLVPLDDSTRQSKGVLGRAVDSCGDCIEGIRSSCTIS